MLTGMCTLVQWPDVDGTFWSQVLVINIARRRDIAVFCNNHVGPSVRDRMPTVGTQEHVPQSTSNLDFETTKIPRWLCSTVRYS